VSAIKTFRRGEVEVTGMLVESVDDIRVLRDAVDWHEGAVALLTFPTADPIAYVAIENPKYFGRAVALGNVVVKGSAGDFAVLDGAAFAEDFDEVLV